MDVLRLRVARAYVAFVVTGVAVGAWSVGRRSVGLDASPFVGHWRWPVGAPLLLPAAVAAAVIVWGPAWAARLRWPAVPMMAGVAASIWAVSLALTDGWAQVTRPVTARLEYERFAATISDPVDFLRTFAARLQGYPIHVKGHPPGATLVPWALDQLGLNGAGWFAALVISGWGVGIGAVLVAVRTVVDEPAARRVAPALVLLPGAVWAATSSDALFTGVLAGGIALAVLGRRWQAGVGGIVLGLGLLLTYGGALLLLVPAAVHLRSRRFGHVTLLVAGVVATLVLVWAASGFWWLGGLHGTRIAYWDGVASRRPALYITVLGNPTALALAIGPMGVLGLVVACRQWREAVLPLSALVAVAMADLSLMSKGEVERIWLPFTVWLAVAMPADRRRWLVAQAAVAIALQAVLRSPW